MKTTLFLGLVLLCSAAGSGLGAQEVGAARTVGQVLVLQSDRCMEGDVEKVGDQYRIRRGASEVWLPAEKAVRLCVDWEDALVYMRSRANLGDPDERLRLARWCQTNNLRAQALEEAKAALDMRPAHAESRKMVGVLTRTLASAPAARIAAVSSTKMVPAAPAPDISADAFALFSTRVQPILMNTCVNCHSGGRGGDFQLLRTEGGQRGATQANLAAVLAQVRVDHALISPLLIKAVSPHGNAANAPLKDRQSIPFKTLEGWINYTLANNQHLKYEADADRRGATVTTERPVPPPLLDKVVSHSAPRLEASPATPSPATPAVQAALDPFDPAIFNRQMHPPK